MEKEINPIDQILDENNKENIILYDQDDNPVEFEQVAIIPLDEELYVILKPVQEMEGVAEDEAIVFRMEGENEESATLEIEDNDEVIDRVFDEYVKLYEKLGAEE